MTDAAPVNHTEALELAAYTRNASNLARCYLEIHERLESARDTTGKGPDVLMARWAFKAWSNSLTEKDLRIAELVEALRLMLATQPKANDGIKDITQYVTQTDVDACRYVRSLLAQYPST